MPSLSSDPTLTVENVTRAMEKVTCTVDKRKRVWAGNKRREVWERIFCHRQVVEKIFSRHSSEEEKLHSCADTYVTCAPSISWKELVEELYDCGEMAAAKEARTFLQRKGEFSETSVFTKYYWEFIQLYM